MKFKVGDKVKGNSKVHVFHNKIGEIIKIDGDISILVHFKDWHEGHGGGIEHCQNSCYWVDGEELIKYPDDVQKIYDELKSSVSK